MNMNEARLLTLIEVIQIALTVHQDGIVWREAPLDSDRHNIGDVNIGWGMPMVMNNSIVFYEFGTVDEDAPPLIKYGKTWRCWTWKPTEAQKQAAKWERNDVINDISEDVRDQVCGLE